MKLVSSNLIWLDLEMTGLDPKKDRILEIATVITDKYLNVIAEGPVFAVKRRKALLDTMDEWNTKQHNASGLVARVLSSNVDENEAEVQTIEFLAQHVPPGKSPICGNSIGHDRRFLYKYMPLLEQFFHYRNLDVSSLKILARSWYPDIYKMWKKESKHQALQDIYDSINELKFYREHIF